jgi:hypothetical protein
MHLLFTGIAENRPNASANRANGATRIRYTLPDGISEGEIAFYNMKSIKVKRFKVDRTFDTLLISTSDPPAGTYYYQFQAGGQTSEGKKLVVI